VTLYPVIMGGVALGEAADWYRDWLFNRALPVWWTSGADHVHGGFHDALDDQHRPAKPIRRARVQCRQAFTYALAGELGWMGAWRAAVRHGWRFFADHHRRENGLYSATVGPRGEAISPEAQLYDQAFALLALAALERTDAGAEDYRGQARALLAALEPLRHGPGYRETGAHPFQANAHMHLLEAALAWAELGEPAFLALAEQLVTLAQQRFIDPAGGFLREFYDADWRPVAGADGELLEPGHQFEWAWLLARWSRQAASPAAADQARGLFAAGARGLDLARGVAVNELTTGFAVRDAGARLWPQTEYIKAAAILNEPEHLLRGALGLRGYLQRPGAGLWWDKQTPDGGFLAEPAPASSFYHLIMACQALFAVAGQGAEEEGKSSV
jgi:mannose-1-phosphate guanylyltransferase/mannose-6-phosphate isomerase